MKILRLEIGNRFLKYSFCCFFSLFCLLISNLFSVSAIGKNNYLISNKTACQNSRRPINIRFIKDLVIEPDENNEKISFNFPAGVDADSKGNIYVVDSLNFRVQVFTRNGAYLRTLGRRGQGPGEFEVPFYITIDSRDNIYIFDLQRKSWVVFTSGGKFLKNIRANKNIFRVEKICTDSNQDIICGYVPFEGNFEIYRINRFDKDFDLLGDLYEKKGVLSLIRLKGGISIFPVQYTPKVIWTMDDAGIIYVSFNKSYEIEILSEEGKLINKISREYQPEKITQEEKNEIIGRLSKRFPKDSINQIEFPKVKPPITHLFIVEDYLYVQRKRLEKENKYLFDVFEKTGRYVDEVILDFQPMVNKNNFIYTLEFDFEQQTGDVVRYKIEKSNELAAGGLQ